jgi:hypothetical protein
VVVTYEHAAGVPIAVPVSCSQEVLEKERIFFSITKVSAFKKRSIGKSVGILLIILFRKVLMELIPMLESMFVYIDFASAENNRSCSGIHKVARSEITLREFFV